MTKSIVGLDISSRRLLAVEIENWQSKKPVLVRAHQVQLERGDGHEGEVAETEGFAAALKRLWSEGGFRSKRVVLGVGNQRVLVRELVSPIMPLKQLREALPYQVADLLPVPVEDTILDFYPIEQIEDSHAPVMRGLLVAVLKDAIEAEVAMISSVGLKVVGVDLAHFALLRGLMPSGALQGTHTAVMIGARTTHIVVARDGIPHFVRILPTGGENVTDAAERVAGGDRALAEDMKYRVGIDRGHETDYRALTESMLEALNVVFGAVRSTNNYYMTNDTGGEIQDVILLGPETRIPGIARAMTEHVGLPVRVVSPLDGIQLGRALAPEALAPIALELAAPIGLALGGK